jgi:hypothetical protein
MKYLGFLLTIIVLSAATCKNEKVTVNPEGKPAAQVAESKDKFPNKEDIGKEIIKKDFVLSGNKSLVGTWRVMALNVVMPSVKGIKDSTNYFRADSTDFKERTGLSRIETSLRENGTYLTVYRNRFDKIERSFSGNWEQKDDKLTLIQLAPEKETYVYELAKSIEGYLRIRSILDYDFDKEKDDRFEQFWKLL